MFAMIRRPSDKTPGSTENFESTRTPSDRLVACVPLLHGDPQIRASLRARASRTPSPVMATVSGQGVGTNHGALLLGGDAAETWFSDRVG